MLNSIKLIGEYLGQDVRGIMVGGKHFVKNLIQETEVIEDTFKNLLLAQENGWFSIKSDNYADFLKSRGVKVAEEVNPVEEKVEEVNPVEEKVEEVNSVEEKVEEVKPAKSKKAKATKEVVTEEVKEEAPSKEE